MFLQTEVSRSTMFAHRLETCKIVDPCQQAVWVAESKASAGVNGVQKA